MTITFQLHLNYIAGKVFMPKCCSLTDNVIESQMIEPLIKHNDDVQNDKNIT